nr:hypothetical protein [uncultured Prevotella sp.]
MEKLIIEEKIEIAAALQNRVDFLKKTITSLKNNGIYAAYFETSLSVCETLINEDKIWKCFN